ncbi:MAG: VirB4 family type IV secretion/conjugal transfer ATPase [Leptospirales bacterium]
MGDLRLSDLRDFRPGVESLIAWDMLIAPGVILQKDGAFLAGWGFSGPDLESASEAELASVSARVSAALSLLGSGWMLHVDLLRLPATDYLPEGVFPDEATRAIDSERRAQFGSHGSHWISKRAICLTFMPPGKVATRAGKWFTKTSGTAPEPEETADLSHHLSRFVSDIDRFEGQCSGVLHMSRLSDGELLTHLHTCLTGKTHPVSVPPTRSDLDSVLASGDLVGGFDPKIGRHFFRVVSVTGFPEFSRPGILDALSQLPFAFRYSVRFLPMDEKKAEGVLAGHRRRWMQLSMGLRGIVTSHESPSGAGDAAKGRGFDVEMAQAENAEGVVRFGYVQFKLIVFDENPGILADRIRIVEKVLGNLGFGSIVEEVNCLSAWIESLPGHSYPNVRKPLMHSLNVADLLPTTTVWTGRDTNPCPFFPPRSPALFLAQGSGTTPFYGNIHVGDLGHTLILGPPGMGKSTLMALLAAQFFRYPRAQVFAFDKGASSFVLNRAAGGEFYEIAGPESALCFCPLSGVDDPAERTWAQGWIEALLLLSGLSLSPSVKAEILTGLKTHADTPVERRNFGVFAERVQNMEVREALRYYTKSGAMGSLLDADSDGLRESRFMVFEMEHAANLPEASLLPLLLYLFHRIEGRLDGQPTVLLLDEVWLFLSNPVFREKIREWLKVLRKKNAAVVFATQQPFDVVNSPIRDVILESCPTKIFLANPEAVAGPSREAYRTMGLSDRSVEIIGQMTPKRQYYMTSPEGKRVFDLGLGPVALAFTGVSDRDELARAREILSSCSPGREFAARWLEHRKLPDWARHVRETTF